MVFFMKFFERSPFRCFFFSCLYVLFLMDVISFFGGCLVVSGSPLGHSGGPFWDHFGLLMALGPSSDTLRLPKRGFLANTSKTNGI